MISITSKIFKIKSPLASPTIASDSIKTGGNTIESIKAALFPEKTDYIFFVAQGDGSHAFTTNEKDHEAAKSIYKINKRKNR